MSERSLKLENGGRLRPKPHHVVECEIHGVKTTWGELSWIGKLSVYDGIDTDKDGECLLLDRTGTGLSKEGETE